MRDILIGTNTVISLLLVLLGATSNASGAPLRYQFFGAVTATDQVLTTVHCTALSVEGAVVEILFMDTSGLQVGSGTLTLAHRETKTASAHWDAVTADVAVFEEDLLIPLTSELDQGMVEVRSSSRALACSAQKLDATSSAANFVEALRVRQLFAVDKPTAADFFPGVRRLGAFVDTAVHCTNRSGSNHQIFLNWIGKAGNAAGATTLQSIGPGQTLTFASAAVDAYREDLVVTPQAPLGQGTVRVDKVAPAAAEAIHCTAELVPTFGVVPAFVGRLWGTEVVPDLDVFSDDFESGDLSAWTSVAP